MELIPALRPGGARWYLYKNVASVDLNSSRANGGDKTPAGTEIGTVLFTLAVILFALVLR